MFKQDVQLIADVIDTFWDLPEPVTLTDCLPRGMTADVWLVEDGAGSRYVAKFAYATQSDFEAGLRVAEYVQRRTGLLTGCPVRDRTGSLTVMLPSVPHEEHPLALLTYVDGTSVGLKPEAAAALLARAHAGLVDLDPATGDDVMHYLTDDSIDIAYADVIRPVLHRTADDVLDCRDLTWGTCYGDGPEAIRTSTGEVALIDWSGVLHAPLLWDVADWAASYTDPHDERGFVAACTELRFVRPEEFTHLEKLVRLRDARQLRFRAWRVLHSDHFVATRKQDADELRRFARRLGIEL